jgi:hypothetical protein
MADAPVMGHVWEYALSKEYVQSIKVILTSEYKEKDIDVKVLCRIMEKWYTEDGYCMPLPKSFRQGKIKPPISLEWSSNPKLDAEINQALLLAEKVRHSLIS